MFFSLNKSFRNVNIRQFFHFCNIGLLASRQETAQWNKKGLLGHMDRQIQNIQVSQLFISIIYIWIIRYLMSLSLWSCHVYLQIILMPFYSDSHHCNFTFKNVNSHELSSCIQIIYSWRLIENHQKYQIVLYQHTHTGKYTQKFMWI